MEYKITIEHITEEYKYNSTHNYVFRHDKEFTKKEFLQQIKTAKDEVLKTEKYVNKENFIEMMKDLFGYESVEYVRTAYLYEHYEYKREEGEYLSDMSENIDDLDERQIG